jgi:pantoate--beta-alanine ligase
MEIIRTIAAWRDWRARHAPDGDLGFVATMGYLHAGHLSLVRMARERHRHVAASIFVNPLQFGPAEDLAAYPRDEARDLRMLERAGVDAVFAPEAVEMYPPGFVTNVTLAGPLVERLEGARRPGHFAGVATVVTKLFAIIQPSHAYFGQKDAQQCAVVQRFVTDLALPVTIVIGPIMREADGLAMSSRNIYLTPEQRRAALALHRALDAAQAAIIQGETRAESVCDILRATIAGEPLATLDYADVVDPATFLPLEVLQTPALLLLVVQVGAPHLLDNYLLRADGTWDVGVTIQEE